MRILYIGSRIAEDGVRLPQIRLEREVQNIEALVQRPNWRAHSAKYCLDLYAEQVPAELATYRPHILQIGGHGDALGLRFASENFQGDARMTVVVDAEALSRFFDPNEPPRLVVLTACNSADVARDLAARGFAAIGTSDKITNEASAAISGLLYSQLIAGASIKQASDAASALARTLEKKDVLELFLPKVEGAADLVISPMPLLAAEVQDVSAADATVTVRLALIGLDAGAVQAQFFTDAPAVVGSPTASVGTRHASGTAWSEPITVSTDCWVVVCCLRPNGDTFSHARRLSEALIAFAAATNTRAGYQRQHKAAIARLSSVDPAR